MSFDAQENVLYRVSRNKAVRSIIDQRLQKETNMEVLVALLQDTLCYRTRLYFRSSEEMIRLLRERGFDVCVIDMAQRRPHPHILYMCRKI